jgi:uncharacterized protein HemY
MCHCNLAQSLFRRGDLDLARLSYEKGRDVAREAHRRNPENTEIRDELAWFLTNCPDVRLRDPAEAVRLARSNVEQAPDSGRYWFILGAALVRAGDLTGAVEALEKACKRKNGGDGFDWFFLAMAHHKLGDRARARAFFEKGDAWLKQSLPNDETLQDLRDEAQALLASEDRAPEPPAHEDAGSESLLSSARRVIVPPPARA